ncbi:hypothetical protein NDU88_007545 [Pleurodeles waltl]|uniref:Uncharacterized protein n=1 Tax=Pleurodeles waltl TaxID=8319 RepID=A0AAV7RTD1_PLEWA|nr:hypothetical protein NDU88_007545 [Pleurodeles waltl]
MLRMSYIEKTKSSFAVKLELLVLFFSAIAVAKVDPQTTLNPGGDIRDAPSMKMPSTLAQHGGLEKARSLLAEASRPAWWSTRQQSVRTGHPR